MQRMPAAMAAVTPTGESSMATHEDGITSSARAALMYTPGSGLPRSSSSALQTASTSSPMPSRSTTASINSRLDDDAIATRSPASRAVWIASTAPRHRNALRAHVFDHLADDLALDGARPDAVPRPDPIPVVDDLLDAHPPGLAQLRVGQLDADPGEHVVLDLTPHRLRVDQDPVHVKHAGGDRPPHEQ